MSIEEMENYFGFVDGFFKFFGKTYRLFWPFPVFSPFSPMRIILNIGVLFSWFFVVGWLVMERGLDEELGMFMARFWAVILFSAFVIGIFERHYRIKFRYRLMKAQRMYNRATHPFGGSPRPPQQGPVYYQNQPQQGAPQKSAQGTQQKAAKGAATTAGTSQTQPSGQKQTAGRKAAAASSQPQTPAGGTAPTGQPQYPGQQEREDNVLMDIGKDLMRKIFK